MIKALSPGESEQEIDRLCMQNYFGGQLHWGLQITKALNKEARMKMAQVITTKYPFLKLPDDASKVTESRQSYK